MLEKSRNAAILRHPSQGAYFDLTIHIGFLIFVLALPFGHSTILLYAGLTLALLGWIGRICRERKLEWKRTPLDIPVALFLVLALVGSFFAPNPSSSSLGYFWKLLRAVLLFYAVIHSRLGERWRYIVVAFLIAGGLSSVLGLWYYLNGTHMGVVRLFSVDATLQSGTGEKLPSVDWQRVFANNSRRLSQNASIYPSNKDAEWVLTDEENNRKYIVRSSHEQLDVYYVEPRLAGTFKMPNDLGAYLVIVVPIAMGYFISAWRIRRNKDGRISIHWGWIVSLGFILCVMAANLALTLTRAAWVAVFFAAVYLAICFKRRLLWGLLILAVLSPFFMPQDVKDRFKTVWQRPSGFMSERPQWWETSTQLIAKYPITGIGIGRFRHEYKLHGPPDMYHEPYHAHNIYLHIAVEQGISSLLIFFWMLFLIFRQLSALRKNDGFWRSGLYIGGSGFLISALIYGLADHILHQRPLLMFWFIIGIVFYVTSQSIKSDSETPLTKARLA